MPTVTTTGFTTETFEAFLAARKEPAWLTEQRREAWKLFHEKPWPARNDEEWIRTDIRLFKLDQYRLPLGESSAQEATQPLLVEGVDLAGRATALDSRPTAS